MAARARGWGPPTKTQGAWVVALLALAVGGCDQNCQNTCSRIYDPSQCAVQISGVEWTSSRSDCEEACETALTRAGQMGDYNPYNRPNPSDPPELENERQAAAWMECVWTVECAELDPTTGICAPTVY
jgi:hypothetical protein